MKLLTRYLSREIYSSLLLVFTSLLMLFAFFDFLGELNDLGKGGYNLGYVFLYVLQIGRASCRERVSLVV